jgi:enediyne biosynthesis protein E4
LKQRKFSKKITLLVSVITALIVPVALMRSSGAASLTWDGEGGDNNWSTCTNWTTNACPAAGDTVTFNSTSTKNSTVDPLFNATETIVTININAGYTGTVTLGTTLHVTTSFAQAAGNFTAASQTLDLNGTFSLSAGNFTASSGVTTLASAMTVTGTPGFTHNNGTFIFDGATGATISCNGISFFMASFAHTGNSTKAISSGCSVPVGNNPVLGGDGLADVTVSGTLTGSGTITVGTGVTGNQLTLNSTASLSGFSGLIAGNLTATSFSINFGSYSPFTINGVYSQSGGTITAPSNADFNSTFTLSSSAVFNAPTGSIFFAGNFTINTGTTFNPSTATVTFDGSGNGAIACNNTAFTLVAFTHTAGTKTIGTDCDLQMGSSPVTNNGSITLNGTLTGSGTLTIGTSGAGNLILNSTSSLVGFTGLALGGNFTLTGASANFGNYSPFTVAIAFALTAGASFTAPSGTMSVGRDFTINSGTTFTHNNGTLNFTSSTSGSSFLVCNNTAFHLVTFTHTARLKFVGSDCNLPVGTNPMIGSGGTAGMSVGGKLSGSGTIHFISTDNRLTAGYDLTDFTGITSSAFDASAGMRMIGVTANFSSFTTFDMAGLLRIESATVFTAPTGTMNVGGNLQIDSGTTFNANGGTLVLDGTNDQTIFGTSTFNNLSAQTTAARKLTFPAAVAQTVTGTLTLKGVAGQLLSLVSSTPSTPWQIDPQGARDVAFVAVWDSTNNNVSNIVALDSTNNGGNTGWTFTKSGTPGTEQFTDVTAASGLSSDLSNAYSHGAAWGDANGDGNVDLYMGTFISGSRTEPSHLFIGDGAGNFTESGQTNLQTLARTSGAVMVDLDNDGDSDLVVSNNTSSGHVDPVHAAMNYLFKNNGDGTYTDISAASGLRLDNKRGRSIGVLDYNGDGYLDLVMHSDSLLSPVGVMRLFKNNGNLTFSDVTASAGIPTNLAGLGMGVADANDDGWPDFAITGGVSGSSLDQFNNAYLFINNQDGTFRNATPASFTWDISARSNKTEDWVAGIGWGDVNRDGRLDVVVGHHFNDASSSPIAPRLYINQGNDGSNNPVFVEEVGALEPIASKAPHVEIQDMDNDGWPDVYASVLLDMNGTQNPLVYHHSGNLSGGVPTFVSPNYTGIEYYAPGTPTADYDKDGKLDIFFEGYDVFNTPTLWHNTTATSNHWLSIKVSSGVNTMGLGAKVKIYTAGHSGEAAHLIGYSEINTGNGYSSGSDPTAHFGLGGLTSVDVRVELPFGGGTLVLGAVTADQILTVTGSGSSDPEDPVTQSTTTVTTIKRSSVAQSSPTLPEETVPEEEVLVPSTPNSKPATPTKKTEKAEEGSNLLIRFVLVFGGITLLGLFLLLLIRKRRHRLPEY